jgi:glutamate 5-kinase
VPGGGFWGCRGGGTRNSGWLCMQLKSRRVVVKFGSGILTHLSGLGLDEGQFEQLVYAVAGLRSSGHEVIVVSSGAVAAGGMAFGMVRRPEDTATLQACAAVGQTRLMQRYESLFSRHGLLVAQLLLTNEDLHQAGRRENLTNTLERLLAFKNVVPIINENDSVATEELKVGDNDRLSAGVAQLAKADILILLTSVDGLLDAEGRVIPEVIDVSAVGGHVRPEKGMHSTGGMASKLGSAGEAVAAGVEVVIANGRNPSQLLAVVEGGGVGTRLRP